MVTSTRNEKPMRPLDYFDQNPVFRHEDFVAAHTAGGRRSLHTSHNVLAQHVAAGRLLRLRRGLYATIPRGLDPKKAVVDPYLIATSLAKDAVVAYHAALQFHGKAHSISSRFTFFARRRMRPFRFRGAQFVPVQVPAALRALRGGGGGVIEQRHAGGLVRVTTLERAMVDVLDAPGYGGGWEEIWRSLETVEFFDLDSVIAYALRLGSALTVARVGFYLEQHREELMVEDRHLKRLRAHAPAQPRYLDRRRKPGNLVSKWNLIVPGELLSRPWSEVP